MFSFCVRNACRRGEIPASGLVQAPSGQLFGAVQDGGARDKGGLIYELSGSHLTPLYKFCEADRACPDGDAPEATPIVDVVGNLYGTAIFNGPNDGGVIYELTP